MEKRNVKDLIWAIIGFLGIGFFVGAIIYVVVNDNKPAPEPVVVPSGGISDLNYYDLLPDPRQVVTGEGNITVYKPEKWAFENVLEKNGTKRLLGLDELRQISVNYTWSTDSIDFVERIMETSQNVVNFVGISNIIRQSEILDCKYGLYDALAQDIEYVRNGNTYYVKLIWIIEHQNLCAIQIVVPNKKDFDRDDLYYLEAHFKMPSDSTQQYKYENSENINRFTEGEQPFISGVDNITLYKPEGWTFNDVVVTNGVRMFNGKDDTDRITLSFLWNRFYGQLDDLIRSTSDGFVQDMSSNFPLWNKTELYKTKYGDYDALARDYEFLVKNGCLYVRHIWIEHQNYIFSTQIMSTEKKDIECEGLKYIEERFRMPNDL